ncbi:YgfZ/GcvT domain-containing protein [Psychromicrobium xiongbiense]|uniref:CAF17-like 4Fe-4S cluster assembly/insertion protein YgfZ n=1 Tax=Psychromicrobium xiongbiense TaxID=3051184 RepID=UPI0025539E62|nr:folate-binding protein [Psychromicrobium sp. YIM S02556]
MTYRSVLLDRPGAVEASGLDTGVAAHYGDPFREQRSLAAGGGIVDQSQRGVVTVSGPDRLSWLTTLSSQDISRLAPGDSAELLLLSIQGRIEYDLHALDDGERLWLIGEQAEAAPLAAWLDSMRFMLRVEVADVSAQWGVVASTAELEAAAVGFGPDGRELRWSDPWPGVMPGGYAYSVVEGDAHPGAQRRWFEYLVPLDSLESLMDALAGLTLTGSWAAEALRIAAWRPRWGAETDDLTIPHELDLLRTAVHLAKGCYKGQETVARVHNLGHPPRRLVFLHLDGSQHTLPAVGSPVMLGERRVGILTSVERHYEMGPIGLAVIKRSVDPMAELSIVDEQETYPAAQEVVVAPDAGQVVGRQTGFLRPARPATQH